jgi:mRNA interferase MazF
MGELVRGDILVIDFPFSDLKNIKRRPVFVVKVPKGEDVIVAQITGSSYEKSVEIMLRGEDFREGSLRRNSFLRIDKIASIEKSLIKYKVGALKSEKVKGIMDSICNFLRS